MNTKAGVIILCTIALLLAACGGNRSKAPVVRPDQTRGAVYDTYTVSPGDTLFSIAWRYGLDYRKLANANNIAAPYVIFPRQKLLLREVTGSVVTASVAQKPVARVVPKVKSSPPSSRPIENKVASKPDVSTNVNADPDGWRWPAAGRVVKAYGSGGAHKGIDIGGKLGEPVFSAAVGSVVYAGSGILGYGNLLIIKHSENYLSAYGHNQRLLVGEGVKVKAGQKIAEKGDSGTNSVKLHFEIRREGKPVDPIRLLPRR